MVDAAQLAPHRRIDLAGSGVDYLAFSGHKLYAPFGSGVLIGRPDWAFLSVVIWTVLSTIILLVRLLQGLVSFRYLSHA